MVRKILIILLGLTLPATFLQAQKAFDEYLVDKNFETFSNYTSQNLSTESADATINVQTDQEINAVRKSLFGQNAVGYQGNLDTNNTDAKNWKNGEFSLIRYPGGNWSNLWFWDGNLPETILTESTIKGNTANLKSGSEGWMLGTDEYPDLLNHTGADGIVCVNVGYAFYGTSPDPVTTAADYAADWVDYYNNTHNVGIKYWELGNENYGPWQAGFDLGSAQKYGDACVIFANKMKLKDPSIKIGVVLYEGYGGINSSPQAIDWNETVLPIVQDVADFLIIHHYPHPNVNHNAISEADIYAGTSIVEESHIMIHDQVATYTNKPADYFPIAATEFNARAGIRNMSRTNTLFTTMMLSEYAKNGYAAATQWDLVNGYNTEAGDHGLVSKRDPFLEEGSVNPEFYAFYYMNRYFGDMVVNSTSNNTDIVTYATTFASGELGLVVINKSPTDKVVELNLGTYAVGQRMYWHTVDGDESDFDRTVYVNGVGPDKTFIEGQSYTSNQGSNDNTQVASAYEVNGVSGPQNYETILPYSALIPAGSPKINTPRYSVSYIVLESGGSDCSVPNLGPDQTICGNTEITLNTQLDSNGLSFEWKNNAGSILTTDAQYIATTEGTYTVEVTNGSCVQTDEIRITNELPTIELGENQNLCQNTSVLLKTDINLPNTNYSWTKNGVELSDQPNYTVYEAGTYEVTVSASGCQAVSDVITITSDLIPVKGDTICFAGETVNLEILDLGSYSWYDSPTEGTELSTQSIYDETIYDSETFYVQNNSSSVHTFGKTNVDGSKWGNTSAGAYEGWGRETEIILETDLTLISFDVSVNTTANIVLTISDGGTYNQTLNFDNLSPGLQTLNLDLELSAGTYLLNLEGTTGGVDIQIDNNGNNTLPDYLSFSITDTEDHYGFFYNWVVSTGSPCARTPVHAVIDSLNSSCPITAIHSVEKQIITVYPNPTTGIVNLSSIQEYTVTTILGELLIKGKGDTIDLSNQSSGIFIIKTNNQLLRVLKR